MKSNELIFIIRLIIDKIHLVFSNKVQKRLGNHRNDTDIKYHEKIINY